MNGALRDYVARRDTLLASIVETLSADERFVAGWLAGSFGRGEQDALSDLDLTLVVAEPYSSALCNRLWQVAGETTAERLALFSRFGKPAVIHENNHNAPEGGTFTFVMYEPSAVMIDWILRPEGTAQRPADSRLLWDRVGIPLTQPPTPAAVEQRAREASEMVAFFWMMAAVTAKYIGRDDGLFVNTWLEELSRLGDEVERRVNGDSWQYRRGSAGTLQPTHEAQLAALRVQCERILSLMPSVVALGGYVPSGAMNTLEVLLEIVTADRRKTT
jgi:hypothetical protein